MHNIMSFKPSYLINDLSILLYFSFAVDTQGLSVSSDKLEIQNNFVLVKNSS